MLHCFKRGHWPLISYTMVWPLASTFSVRTQWLDTQGAPSKRGWGGNKRPEEGPAHHGDTKRALRMRMKSAFTCRLNPWDPEMGWLHDHGQHHKLGPKHLRIFPPLRQSLSLKKIRLPSRSMESNNFKGPETNKQTPNIRIGVESTIWLFDEKRRSELPSCRKHQALSKDLLVLTEPWACCSGWHSGWAHTTCFHADCCIWWNTYMM